MFDTTCANRSLIKELSILPRRSSKLRNTSRRRKGREPDPPPPNHTAMRIPTQTENSSEVLRAYPTGAERCLGRVGRRVDVIG